MNACISLDMPVKDGEDASLGELLPDESGETEEEIVSRIDQAGVFQRRKMPWSRWNMTALSAIISMGSLMGPSPGKAVRPIARCAPSMSGRCES